jgi:hypothetical protein
MGTKQMILLGVLALSLGLLAGCSQVAPNSTESGGGSLEEQIPPNNLSHYQYPEAANNPPPGYQFLQPAPGQTPSTDDLYAAMMIHRSKGGTLWLNGSCISIAPWAIPSSQWISMYQPSTNELYVDFETHGLFFDGPQQARISYADWTIPPGLMPQDLVIWYWNDELGVYEFIGGINHVESQYIDFCIDHFSRYVVAGPVP